MNTSIVKWTGSNNPWHELAQEIRFKVFIEEQKVEAGLEYENEEESNHYLLFEKEKAVATGRWRKTNQGIKFERFAVLPDYRNSGLGTELLLFILNDLKAEQDLIYLHSQLRAVPYYRRSGFVVVGEHFFEAGIEHVKMIYKS